MPLDTQPLSPLRNAIRVVAMLALLGSSLAFANFLTRKHSDRVVTFDAPAGAAGPMPVNHSWPAGQGTFIETTIQVDGSPVECAAFDILTSPASGQSPDLDARRVLWGITQDESLTRLYNGLKLGGVSAVQFDQAYRPPTEESQQENQSPVASARYAILRLAVVDHRLVAICFSGDAGNTDAIKQSFNAYCLKSVHVGAP